MADLKPTEKVQAAGYAGAASILFLYLLDPEGNLPPLVASSITLLIAGLGAWIKTEGSGWLSLFKRRGGDHAQY